MPDELKPSPEAVRIAEDVVAAYNEWGCHSRRIEDAALVIDRALRPATTPGDVVEENARLQSVIDRAAQHWLDLQGKHPIQWEGDLADAMKAGCDHIRATAMQPAIQAAVDALDAVMTYGDRAAVNIARSALTTLRTVTEQGEG